MARGEKLQRSFEDFKASFEKLNEAVSDTFRAQYKEEIIIEIVTKRFEYTYETLWKLLKELLLEEGVETATPLQCFKEAFKIGLVSQESEEIFPLIVKKRNEIVHIYSADKAYEIYLLIRNSFIPAITAVSKNLQKRIHIS
ncbi:MAG: hypothetical protein A3I05_09835 [Deltaproteobacteria bacterium RIFCSPLOWO2_02_FULL_44_10]|nr:MAG: hypothetical protein A3C46_09350 [Deltaproteobacteria bacterium RIFCSPHIGHO2_02_FULL_44_16]OGQ44994.1 MAG: hypothetical protein A3I05_09835 [Deltaproteobacteria bacterium RIFCSPLOWO2_02_FULL_44_10]